MTDISKPKILYHASSNRDIKIFEPRSETVRDPHEGPVIFATPNIIFASMFLVSTNDSWVRSGRFGTTYYIVISDEERFRRADNGGAIYTLPPDTFTNDPSKGMGKNEWVSKVSVIPIKKDVFESGLQTMLNFGVQIFFVDAEAFEKIVVSSDHGFEVLSNTKSYNEKVNINFKKLG